MFAERLIRPELLDHAEPEEARRNLADLVRINERFGGHGVLQRILERTVPRDEPFTMLDVGAASGDTALTVRRLFPLARVFSLDCHVVNLTAAPQPKILADAFRLPFGEGSFDYVYTSLFLHHFPDEQVVQLLASFYKVARRGLLVNDLERQVLPFIFLPATKYIFGWQRITLHDGPISVRAAFRKHEMEDLARRAGIGNARVEVHRPAFRISMIAMK
jgi:hypothetical protein